MSAARRAVGVIALSLFAGEAMAEELQRLALIMGSNNGGAERSVLRYADTDASAFATVLTELGGLDPFDIILISDPDREEVEKAFDTLATRAAVARQAGRRVEVILYYSGHSNIDGLLPRGELLPYSTFRARLSMLDADVKVSVLDSCASGALVRTKGGVRRPSFLVDQTNVVRGEAYLTSSTADEASQESDEIQASYFTHHLVTGLRGVADADQDGLVTLGEAYRYTFRETRASTENSVAGPQNPFYALDLVGQGDLVMTDLRAATSLLVLEERLDGELWIRGADGSLLAEVDKRIGSELTLFVPPGSYRITLQTRPDQFVADVEVGNGAPTVVDASLFEINAQLDTGRTRGDAVAIVADPPPKEEEEEPVADPDAPPVAKPYEPPVAQPAEPVEQTPAETHTEDDDPTTLQRVAFQVIPGVGTPTRHPVEGGAIGLFAGAHDEVRGAQVSSIMSISRRITGAQMASIGNIARDELKGLQGSAIFNYAGGQDRGFQVTFGLNISGPQGPNAGVGGQGAGLGNVADGSRRGGQVGGVFNVVGRHLSGAQLGGVWNQVGGEVNGVQMSGLGNYAGGGFTGTQISAGINISRGMRGAQLGLINAGGNGIGAQLGLVNTAKTFQGLQLGLINVARESRGESIGLLNFIGNGYHAFEVYTDDISPVNLSFKFGGRHVYSLVNVGMPGSWSDNVGGALTLGWGLGGHAEFGKGYVDVDVLVRTGKGFGWFNGGTVGVSLRPAFGVRFGKHFGLILGPTLNYSAAVNGRTEQQSFMPAVRLDNDEFLWGGFQAGMNIKF